MRAFLITLLLLIGSLGISQKSFAATDSCEYVTASMIDKNLVGPLSQISRMEIFGLIKDCLLTAANAAWESVKDVGNCVMHPIDCAESAVDGIKNAYHFITNISEEVSKIWNTMKNLNARQIGEMICSVVGSLAPDVLVAILTAGAASGKLGPTIAKIMLKIRKITALIQEGIALPIKLLGKLTEEAIADLKKLFKVGGKHEFELNMRRAGCALP